MNQHIEGDAALYALGALDGAARAHIDEHVATCAPCARALGDAEVAVDTLEAHRGVPARALLEPRRTRSKPHVALGALAAVLVLALLASAAFVQNVRLSGQAAQTGLALSALASSHFNHVSFVPAAPGAPAAKAVYAKHGEWLYLIVRGSDSSLALYGIADGKRRLLGIPTRGSGVETLFVPKSGRLTALELTRAGKPIGRATPAY